MATDEKSFLLLLLLFYKYSKALLVCLAGGGRLTPQLAVFLLVVSRSRFDYLTLRTMISKKTHYSTLLTLTAVELQLWVFPSF